MTENTGFSWKCNLFYFNVHYFPLKAIDINGFDTTVFLERFVVFIYICSYFLVF